MNTIPVLSNMNFGAMISFPVAHTQTGSELLTKYRAFLTSNPESNSIINQFVIEATPHIYDSGVNEALGSVTEYIQNNKIAWALASACEIIEKNGSSLNILNRNASRKVRTLLENYPNESELVNQVRAGALQDVMYCEAFRKIANIAFESVKAPMTYKTEYSKYTPISVLETSDKDGSTYFVVAEQLFRGTPVKGSMPIISEGSWSEVSNTFKTIAQILNSNLASVDYNSDVVINYNGTKYTIKEDNNNNVTIFAISSDGSEKTYNTVESFREYANLVVIGTNQRHKNTTSQVLESIALMAENYNNIALMDNVSIYTTQNDKFMVIESGADNIYATLLSSVRTPKWTISEGAYSACNFIKEKTNTDITKEYTNIIENSIAKEESNVRKAIKESAELKEVNSIRERISLLVEKFSDDPQKLSVLAKLAAEVSDHPDDVEEY